MKRNYNVGIIGATGMVGQQFIRLLDKHPWFNITLLAASERSAGQEYREAVNNRWKMDIPVPEYIASKKVINASEADLIAEQVDFVFCAVDMDKKAVIEMEEKLAGMELPVISANSANRMRSDIPMLIPELNPDHSRVIELQRKRLGVKKGFIAVKPNCSIQSYVPPLHPLKDFGLKKVIVSNYQAVSGAGKRFSEWPEMIENLIPYISGEEEKSEKEPLKIWGKITDKGIDPSPSPVISAQCYRVAVADGHTSSVAVQFERKPRIEEIIERWESFSTLPQSLELPSAPSPFIKYHRENDRPQVIKDRDFENGMGISVGRLREDPVLHYKFTCLSHNTIRGAAGGAVLTAELLAKQGYL